jgi:beta-mannanase
MTSTPFPLGVCLDEPNPGDPSAEAQFEADYTSFVNLMGTTPSYINTYVDNTQPISSWVANSSYQAWSNANSPDAQGLTPVIGLPMFSNAAGSGTPDQQYQAFASGQYHSVLTGIVNAWAAQGVTSLVFRPGWEFNLPGPTYAGDSAQDQSDWVAAFQHIYTVLHQAGSADDVNISVVWNPGVTNYRNAEATTNMYPGNQYVDVIGAGMYSDMYPYSDGTNSSGQPQYTTGTPGRKTPASRSSSPIRSTASTTGRILPRRNGRSIAAAGTARAWTA